MLKIILLLNLILLCQTSFAARSNPIAPKVAAKGYFLFDMNSEQVLAEKNADERLEPASLTKIMTAHVIFQEIKEGNMNLDDQVIISKKAWKTEGSRMFIEVNKKVSVENLLKGMIIQSGNDAAVALAEHAAGSEEAFSQLMNETAKNLGMTHSAFQNATGLPAKDHYTTARDIAKVTAATIRDFPDFYEWYKIKHFTFNKIKQPNRNRLLWRDKDIDGVKTGHTKAAGYCLVASGQKEDTRLISVILGTKSDNARMDESQKILNFGFRFYETHKIYDAHKALTKVRVWKGSIEQLSLGIAKDLYVTIPRKQYKNLKPQMKLNKPVMAPKRKGDIIGKIELKMGTQTIKSIPLLALKKVDEGGFFHNLVDAVKLYFE